MIVNPAAGKGGRSGRIDAYLRLLGEHLGSFEHRFTARPGEEIDLTDYALSRGADLIVAVGGDGTWGNVAGRIVDSGRGDVALGLLPAGTGNDFAKALGIFQRDPEGAVRVVAGTEARRVDIGRGTFSGKGKSVIRSFLLVAGFGIDTAVLKDVERARFLPGDVVYRLAALRQLFTFGTVPLRFSEGGGRTARGKYLMLVACNAPSIGGSFVIAPSASPVSGSLHACAIRDGGLRDRVFVFRSAVKGSHGRSPLVDLFPFGRLSVEFDRPTRYQIDGELAPDPIERAEIEAVPGALPVMAPTSRG